MRQKLRVKRHAVTQPLNKPYCFIPLTRNQNAIVDVEDFDWLNQFNWCAGWNPHTESFYAQRRDLSNSPTVWMHLLILKCKSQEMGDHKNHNTLDNRRGNLRKCTPAQNIQNASRYSNNTSGYKGVSWDSYSEKWRAVIYSGGRKISLGLFDSPKDAGRAYDLAAKDLFKEFAVLNFS